MSKKEQFIAAITPHAQAIQQKYGVPASIVIAQAALETGWGEKVKGNNYFGVKAGDSWKGDRVDVATHEYVNGKRVALTDSFRAYGSLKESVTNYGQMLARSARYASVVTSGGDAYDIAEGLHDAGYATDPKYADKLKDIISQNNLTRLDDASHHGYTDGERFEQTRRRLREQREANPAPWEDMVKGIFQLIFGVVASIGSMMTGDTVNAPTDLPQLAGRQALPARG
jgi:flagellum-specific peptidoglycan hydrolase FlgJ